MPYVLNNVRLPYNLTGSSYHYPYNHFNSVYKGIYLQTTEDKTTIIGSYLGPSFDTFYAIPTVDLYLTDEYYMYYALSVDGHSYTDGSVVLVGTANQTQVNITVPISAIIKMNNSANWSSLHPGVLYSYEIQRLQIAYIATPGTDLTGTKVITNKPVSFFSGHQCVINTATRTCETLVEQFPPTKLWGKIHYFAPLAGWKSYKVKIMAAYDSTNVDIYCNNTIKQYVINAGKFINVTYSHQEFCGVYSNQKVLVSQFSDYQDSQTMMTLIPSTIHYTNHITSSTPNNYYLNTMSYNHYINIVVLAEFYHPELISITTDGEVSESLDSQSWVPIIVNNVTHAYTTQVNIKQGVFKVAHVNKTALLTVVVYGYVNSSTIVQNSDVFPGGYGHPGWLMDHSVGMFINGSEQYYIMYICSYMLENYEFKKGVGIRKQDKNHALANSGQFT